jgi:hypothetical protein
MGLGVSIFLIAVGAVLVWAVDATVAGLEVTTLGWILLIVGAAGALLSLIVFGTRDRRVDHVEREDVVVRHR